MTFLLLLLATLHGQVTDPSGSAIPGAAVTVTQGTTVAARTLTDSQGRFQFDELQAGAYVLRVTAPGFAASETAINTLRDGQSLTSNVRMKLAVQQQEVIVNDAAKVDVDPASNAGALVMRGKDLEALSDDRDDLAADLQALAGPASGPNGGQIFIDGFTGGRLPPKSSILEVRVNSNPFAAQFDRPGGGRIEIITKPGADEYHGELQFRFSDDSLNSRNPFNPTKPPYQRRQWEGNITGPINKKTSFFVDFERKDEDTNAFVNALTLDANLFPTPFTAGIVQPTIGVEVNFRLDRQLSKKHSLSARYGYARDTNDNQGVGGFSLPSRAYGVHDDEDTWTVTDTGILNARTVNEIRMRFRSQRTRESAGSTLPTISVLDSFTSGGAPQLDAYTNQKRLELQETVSFARNKHVIRGGGRLRVVSLDDLATQNYAGTYTFTSLDSYRQTLLKTPGAGPSQFTLSGGDPLASVKQFDLGLFAQDDWRVRPNLTLSLGMRYETQNNIHDGRDFAPRAAFALGLGRNNGKAPRTVLRGGVGVFYDRFGESYTLEAERLNGIRQQQFVVPFPAFYPAIPSLAILAASRLPQAIRTIDSNLRVPASYQGAAAIERQLPKNTTLSLTYTETRGIHALRSRNIGVPPASDYYYEASGRFRQHQLVTNLTARVSPKFTLTSFYAWNRANSDTDSARTFPSSSSDLTSEYGRAGFDVRHRFLLNGSYAGPWGLRLSPFLIANSGLPFNITTGTDLNGDGLYTDRPSFATDLNRPSVARTVYGNFDTAPVAGQTLIPRNLGRGMSRVALDLRLSKTFVFGEQAAKKAKRDPVELALQVSARNILNHPNLGLPVGNLSSRLFGQSTGLVSGGGGGGGGGNAAGNRRLDLQVKVSF